VNTTSNNWRLAHDLRCHAFSLQQLGECSHQFSPGSEEALVGTRPPQDFEGREPGRGRHGVARQGAYLREKTFVADRVAIEMGHDVGPSGDRRQRKAAADHLAERAQIRHDAVILLRAAIGETEAGHDLVEDQQDTVIRGDLAQSFEKPGIGGMIR